MNEGFDVTKEGINIFNHIDKMMNDAKFIAKYFMRPTSKLVSTSGEFQYFLNGIVIIYPKKNFLKDNGDCEHYFIDHKQFRQ